MNAVVAGAVAFLISGSLVPLLVRFAVGRDLLDVPNLRSSHEVPTPRLGGVAIILGTWVGVFILRPEGGWPLLVSATLIGVVGLVDDFGSLHFGAKALAQTLVAAALILFYQPPVLSGASSFLAILVFGVGVLWIVALSNAFNFMDGIDGIIAGVTLVNVLFLSLLTGNAVLTLLAGAALGFLIWNISPASIFLGDSGSYFLGFSLAAAALYAPLPPGGWNPLIFFACVLVFTPLLFDTAYTLLQRLRAGKNIFTAHREHVYQRITSATSMHRRTSNIYYGLSVVAGLGALLVSSGGTSLLLGLALILACCAGIMALPKIFKSS